MNKKLRANNVLDLKYYFKFETYINIIYLFITKLYDMFFLLCRFGMIISYMRFKLFIITVSETT